jgi:metallo-beta-lactamase class B
LSEAKGMVITMKLVFENNGVCKYPWDFRVAPFKIIDNLYYVGNRDVSCYLIDSGEGLILHDTGFPQTVYLLLESIRELGFNPKDIQYIIHSHGHYDHFGGTRALVELIGGETFFGKEDIHILTSKKDLTWATEYGVKFYETFNVDHPLNGGDMISLGNINIRCAAIPGHTPGAISYFFDMESGGKTYRVGTHGGPGLNTLSDEYLDRNSLSYNKRKVYLESLQKLKKEKVDIFISIHPDQNEMLEKAETAKTGQDNPFINAGDWGRTLNFLEKSAIELFDR